MINISFFSINISRNIYFQETIYQKKTKNPFSGKVWGWWKRAEVYQNQKVFLMIKISY